MQDKLNTLIILFKAHQSLTKNVKKSIQDTQLTVNEFTVLEALYTKKELSTGQLIDSILIPNSSMTYVLDILEERELIKRIKDPNDKRRQLMSLTKNGSKLFEEVYQNHYQHMKSIFSVLTQDEEIVLQNTLKKLGKKAEEVSNS